jgi:hypothetical protein
MSKRESALCYFQDTVQLLDGVETFRSLQFTRYEFRVIADEGLKPVWGFTHNWLNASKTKICKQLL